MADFDPGIVDRLGAHGVLASSPRHELEWLAAHGALVTLGRGEVFLQPGSEPGTDGDRINALYVVLAGRLVIHVRRASGPEKLMEWSAGDVTGLLPYSRVQASPGTVSAEEPTELWTLDRGHFPGLIRECHEITTKCVHVMLDRARHFTTTGLLNEKLVSLGKLAAGLAHELNNPASAVARNAKELEGAVADLEAAARDMGGARMTAEQTLAVEQLRQRCTLGAPRRVESPVERSDREEAIADWLDDHGARGVLAAPLAESAASIVDLDGLAATLPTDALPLALRWVAAGCYVRQLIGETETAAARVHTLVAAVKGFTHMDQAQAPSAIDLRKSLSDTIAVLASKARAKSVELTLDAPEDVPKVEAIGGEINQVWANLIENALDAVPQGGHVAAAARAEGGRVVVTIMDDGPGIPDAIRSRIYEPFFTTKPVGQGTGLGLDIARRLVGRAGGTMTFDSRPGRTEFRVTLPAPEQAGARKD